MNTTPLSKYFIYLVKLFPSIAMRWVMTNSYTKINEKKNKLLKNKYLNSI